MGLMLGVALFTGGCSFTSFLPSAADTAEEELEPQVSSDALVEPGVLTVAFNTSDAPEGLVAEDGTVSGYYADVASALARKLGLKVAFVNAASADGAISDGDADLFIGAASSDGGSSLTVFGDCLEDAPAIFVSSDRAENLSAMGLTSMTIGVQSSSSAQDALSKAGIAAQQESYTNVNECFEALAAGEVDCIACDATSGAYLARAYDGIAFAGILDAVTVEGVAVDSDNAELIDAVTEALDELSIDGTLDAVHAAWYGSVPLSLSDSMLDGVTVSTSSTRGSSSDEDADDADDDSSDGSSDIQGERLSGIDTSAL